MSVKVTTEMFISRGQQKYGNLFTYEKTQYITWKTKVIITCPIHGDFEITPGNYLTVSNYGCIQCGNAMKSQDKKKTATTFINEATALFKGKYRYDKVIYTGAHDKTIITCPKHGDFVQKPNSHLNGHGCPDCGYENSDIAKRRTIQQPYPVKLYYIQIPELGLWKIGCTKDLNQRFTKYTLPYTYNVLQCEAFDNSIEAYFIEAWMLKATFADKVTGYSHIMGHTELRSNPILNFNELLKEAKGQFNER